MPPPEPRLIRLFPNMEGAAEASGGLAGAGGGRAPLAPGPETLRRRCGGAARGGGQGRGGRGAPRPGRAGPPLPGFPRCQALTLGGVLRPASILGLPAFHIWPCTSGPGRAAAGGTRYIGEAPGRAGSRALPAGRAGGSPGRAGGESSASSGQRRGDRGAGQAAGNGRLAAAGPSAGPAAAAPPVRARARRPHGCGQGGDAAPAPAADFRALRRLPALAPRHGQSLSQAGGDDAAQRRGPAIPRAPRGARERGLRRGRGARRATLRASRGR